jgi:hypothetical protein
MRVSEGERVGYFENDPSEIWIRNDRARRLMTMVQNPRSETKGEGEVAGEGEGEGDLTYALPQNHVIAHSSLMKKYLREECLIDKDDYTKSYFKSNCWSFHAKNRSRYLEFTIDLSTDPYPEGKRSTIDFRLIRGVNKRTKTEIETEEGLPGMKQYSTCGWGAAKRRELEDDLAVAQAVAQAATEEFKEQRRRTNEASALHLKSLMSASMVEGYTYEEWNSKANNGNRFRGVIDEAYLERTGIKRFIPDQSLQKLWDELYHDHGNLQINYNLIKILLMGSIQGPGDMGEGNACHPLFTLDQVCMFLAASKSGESWHSQNWRRKYDELMNGSATLADSDQLKMSSSMCTMVKSCIKRNTYTPKYLQEIMYSNKGTQHFYINILEKLLKPLHRHLKNLPSSRLGTLNFNYNTAIGYARSAVIPEGVRAILEVAKELDPFVYFESQISIPEPRTSTAEVNTPPPIPPKPSPKPSPIPPENPPPNPSTALNEEEEESSSLSAVGGPADFYAASAYIGGGPPSRHIKSIKKRTSIKKRKSIKKTKPIKKRTPIKKKKSIKTNSYKKKSISRKPYKKKSIRKKSIRKKSIRKKSISRKSFKRKSIRKISK